MNCREGVLLFWLMSILQPEYGKKIKPVQECAWSMWNRITWIMANNSCCPTRSSFFHSHLLKKSIFRHGTITSPFVQWNRNSFTGFYLWTIVVNKENRFGFYGFFSEYNGKNTSKKWKQGQMKQKKKKPF